MTITNKNELYSTSDLTLAVTLSLQFPIESIDKKNPKKAIFFFEKSPQLEQLVSTYLRGEVKISPQIFSSQLRALKSRLYNIE